MRASKPKLFRWKAGRQDSGYKTMPLVYSHRFKCDVHLIFYPEGSEIPPHKDHAMFEQRHYRINVELHKAKKGGEFQCSKCIVRLPRFALFRPDMEVHSVSKIEKGSRLMLSIGWLRKPAKPQGEVL